ncbi:MAG: hypothetical protein NWP69_04515, partial [Congregibacter sp.]|nr:hypothetical protein [Congregibacter sp.]
MSPPNANQPTADYAVTCAAIADSDFLREEWQALQAEVAPSFFLDWLWIGTWLDTYHPDAIVVRISLAEQVVALGIFSRMPERRHIVLRSNISLLHQTGLSHQDQIWIEYNGLLAAQGHEARALSLAVQTVQKQ